MSLGKLNCWYKKHGRVNKQRFCIGNVSSSVAKPFCPGERAVLSHAVFMSDRLAACLIFFKETYIDRICKLQMWKVLLKNVYFLEVFFFFGSCTVIHKSIYAFIRDMVVTLKASLPACFNHHEIHEHLGLAWMWACFKRTWFSFGDTGGAGKGCLGSGSTWSLSAPRTTLRCPKTLRGRFPPEIKIPSSCDTASFSYSRSGIQRMVTSSPSSNSFPEASRVVENTTLQRSDNIFLEQPGHMSPESSGLHL